MVKFGMILKDNKEQQIKIRKFITFAMDHRICKYDRLWESAKNNENREDLRVVFEQMPICMIPSDRPQKIFCQLEDLSAGGCKVRLDNKGILINKGDLVNIYMPFISFNQTFTFQLLRIIPDTDA